MTGGRLAGPLGRHLAGLRALLVLTVLSGVLYPLLITGVGAVAFPGRRDGSPVRLGGRVVGSSLLGQSFSGRGGAPLPQWFQPRPSAGGYDAMNSGPSNLGPASRRLLRAVRARRTAVAAFDSVPGHPVLPSGVPADAVTASGSGLDPDISPAYAREQVYRVARARHLPVALVRALVARFVQGRSLGFLGEPRVDVLQLNLALARLRP